jgi:hypothetical protein
VILLGLIWLILLAANGLRGSALPGLVATGLAVAVVGFFLLGVLVAQILGAGLVRGARLGGALAGALLRAVLGVVGLLFAALAGLFGQGTRTSSGTRRTSIHPAATPVPATVRRFRVQDLQGDVSVCILNGDTEGDDVRPGDPVRVVGRRDRHGVLAVNRVEVLSGIGGVVVSTVRPTTPPDLQTARWTRRLTVTAATVLVPLIALQLWTLLH